MSDKKCADCSRRKFYQVGYNDGCNANKWIPCSERLPSESGEYLVWYDCGNGEKGCMVVNFDVGIGSFGDWYSQYDSHTLGFLDSEFIYCDTAVAWMPLPEPYREE